jgi:hypothetical protein
VRRLPPRRAARAAPLLLALGILFLPGCSTYSDKVARLRAELGAGRPDQALASLEKMRGDGDDLPYLLEMGQLQYLTGDLEGCQASFARAQDAVDELFTTSLSREAARLIYNDSAQAYQGEIFERVWIHYFRALAFLETGDVQAAAVEGRAVTRDLERYAAAGPDEAKYRNDPFLQYFAGLLYELDGQLNDAWINYREAERLYEAVDVYGVPIPAVLVSDLIRAGRRLGFADLLAPYLEKYPSAAAGGPEAGEGELVLLLSTGLVPPKLSERIDFPIFKSSERDPEDTWRYASLAYEDWRYRAADLEIDYVLSIALPAVAASGPLPEARWQAAGREGRLELGADLGALSRRCLEDRYAGVVVRTVARALLKYLAKEKIEEETGRLAGVFANILGSATEVADTRGWSTLPEYVHVARIALPAGRQSVTVEAGACQASAEVEIQSGRLSFLAMRLY